jgi:hypothetical protein
MLPEGVFQKGFRKGSPMRLLCLEASPRHSRIRPSPGVTAARAAGPLSRALLFVRRPATSAPDEDQVSQLDSFGLSDVTGSPTRPVLHKTPSEPGRLGWGRLAEASKTRTFWRNVPTRPG